MFFVIFGPPGAGKGTMAHLLHEQYHFETFATGDALRAEIHKGTEEGKFIASCIDNGNFVPDEVSFSFTKDALEDVRKKNIPHLLVDGYPRSFSQAALLENYLEETQTVLNGVIYLDIPDKSLIERLSHRMVCPKCGFSYHTVTLPPKVEGICDTCGVMLERRKDDTPEAIKNRLEIYHRTTQPLFDYYRKKGLLIPIPSNCSIDEQFANVEKALGLKP